MVASFGSELEQLYESSYEAGKALVKMWEKEQYYSMQITDEEPDEPYWEDDDDPWDPRTTQPIDMSKVWSKP